MLLNKGTFEGKKVLSEKSVCRNGNNSVCEAPCKIHAERSGWFKKRTRLLD